MLKQDRKAGRDILTRFRELAPQYPPIAIQRWSVRRILLTISVAFGFLIALSLVIDNIRTGAL